MEGIVPQGESGMYFKISIQAVTFRKDILKVSADAGHGTQRFPCI